MHHAGGTPMHHAGGTPMHRAGGTPASVPKTILFPAEEKQKSNAGAPAAGARVDEEGPWDEEVLGPGVIGRLGEGKRGGKKGGEGEAKGGWQAKKTWEATGAELRKRRPGSSTGFESTKSGSRAGVGAMGGSVPVGFTPRGAKVRMCNRPPPRFCLVDCHCKMPKHFCLSTCDNPAFAPFRKPDFCIVRCPTICTLVKPKT
jgi:hypothetical protein